MKRIVYIIPGYPESHIKHKSYNIIAKIFESHNIMPIHVEVDWKCNGHEQFSDYTEQFLKIYKKRKGVKTYILGFSYGAMVAFLTASKTKPDALILCSLSPYFKEDLKTLKPEWLQWWKDNFVNSDYSFNKIAKGINSRTILIVGDKEDNACRMRSMEAEAKIKNSSLYIAKGAKHKIGQKQYLDTIKKVINDMTK